MHTNLCTGTLLTATINYLYPIYHEIKHTNGMIDRAEKNNNTGIKTVLFKLNKFHIRGLNGYFNSHNTTKNASV